MWNIQKRDRYDPQTHDPLTHCLLCSIIPIKLKFGKEACTKHSNLRVQYSCPSRWFCSDWGREYQCKHDRLSQKGMSSGVTWLLIFLEITDNISETVQNKNI